MGEDFSVMNFAWVIRSLIKLGLSSFLFQGKAASSVIYFQYSKWTFPHFFKENIYSFLARKQWFSFTVPSPRC